MRIRAVGVSGDAFGPGQAQLLEQIRQTGSLPGSGSPTSNILHEGLALGQYDERKLR
jgi:hypothetical protein